MQVSITQTRDPAVSTTGTIRVAHWDKRDRTKRAAKLGAMCWGAAVVAVFIPMLHFILVPALLIAGPIVFFITLGKESAVLGGEGVCPYCKAPFVVAPAAFKFPLNDLCSKCQNTVKISPVNAGDSAPKP